MSHRNQTSRSGPRVGSPGFTILELMVVVAIIGIVAAIAIPNFLRYQAKSKTAEVKTSLGSLRVAEEAYFSEHGTHYAANPEPPFIPGPVQVDFDAVGSDFAVLGWSPDGRVYYSYAVVVSPDGLGYTADAGADLDDDGFVQLWGYAVPDAADVLLDGTIGCDVSFIGAKQLGRCSLDGTVF